MMVPLHNFSLYSTVPTQGLYVFTVEEYATFLRRIIIITYHGCTHLSVECLEMKY